LYHILFFTADDLAKAKEMQRILESGQSLCVPDVVFPELEYVLSGQVYGMNREKIITMLRVAESMMK